MRVIFAATLWISCLSALPASGQLLLHNGADSAQDSAPSAKSAEAAPTAPPPKAKPIPMKTPSEDSVLGHDLRLNGAKGWLVLTRQGKDLGLSRLSFDGEQISQPEEPCHVDVEAGLPLPLRLEGHPSGPSHYSVDLPACPFSFDVLEGAVFVPSGQACSFEAADCHVDPAGLWGPQGNTITPAKAKEMERTRVRIESDMRANFRVLLAHAGKDKAAVKRIAAEQAGFSSERETLCRSYALETQHGFCALEMTRARVLALLAKLDAGGEPSEDKAKRVTRKRFKPVPKLAAPVQPPGQ